MSKKREDGEEVEEFEEPSLEDFLIDEEDDEDTRRRKKRRTKWKKAIATTVAIGLLFSAVGALFNMFSIDAIQFLQTSYRLSQQEDIQEYRQSVVTVQGETSRGTGFTISEDGFIVTNDHVIEGERNITVAFRDGELYEGEVVETYPEIDIAFLKIDGEDLTFLPLRDQSSEAGEDIYVIGNPLSFTQIANEGTIIASQQSPLQISAPIYRGNSGSPVIAKGGHVVGVVYAKTAPSLWSRERPVGLAVPVDTVIDYLPEGIEP
ncbi:S1C family serine protease [Desertibacillus haloalkaliphilus]|uniref:S1C family serine protease n=1 Tax=Desertibacillus haloalkaliphilus TaxID=1328930 RepID=UPI001C255262|nr:serine protease [Desertibacillus haloalkaliphilus]MBU8907971.1 serine protease [Desertibacillus haloalkaliphilus]